jgi:[ribosomal protein S5]-alanine N-acetyltransferase
MVSLREVKLEDAEFLFKTKNDKEFKKYFPEMLIPKNLGAQEKEIREITKNSKNEQGKYFIILEKNKSVGFIDIYKINKKHKRCSIGYGIAHTYWGKGYATKALKLVLKKIKKLGLHTIEATTHQKNIASQKVLQKNGFEKIGLMKDYYYSNNKYIDRILYWKVLSQKN